MIPAILLLLGFGVVAILGFCVTHSLGWYGYWSQRAHQVLGRGYDVRWNTGRAV